VLETFCGNGTPEVLEQCDVGIDGAGDGCSLTCRIDARCGDGGV
jgi:cysteine-rich repeat protein